MNRVQAKDIRQCVNHGIVRLCGQVEFHRESIQFVGSTTYEYWIGRTRLFDPGKIVVKIEEQRDGLRRAG